MRSAMDELRQVIEIIDNGETGAVVSMPLDKASLAFRFSRETLEEMGRTKNEVGLRVEGDLLQVTLQASLPDRTAGASFFYGVIQNLRDAKISEQILKTPKMLEKILKAVPEFRETATLIAGGECTIDEEEVKAWHIKYAALWLSLPTRDRLPHPANLF